MALWTTSFSRSNLPFIQTISKPNKTHLKAKHQCLWYFLSLQRAVSLNITPELKDKLLAQVAYHGKDPVSLQGMGIKCFLGENPQRICPPSDLLHQRSLKNSRVTFFFCARLLHKMGHCSSCKSWRPTLSPTCNIRLHQGPDC